MSISEPFIRRPIGTSLLMLGVLVFGIGAYGLLPVAPLPNVDFPTITVTASYPGASPPTYRKVNPADFPIMIYAVHSDAVPEYRLDDYANTVLAQRLSTVPGVGQVSIFGQKPYAARVQVNPAALAAHGIGLEDVRSALTNATVNLPKGSIEGPHEIVALETNDQLFDATAYGNVIVAYRNGAPVRLKDIGQV